MMKAIISKDGDVKDLTVVAGTPGIQEHVVEAVRQWKFKPYLIDNTPVEVQTTITLNILLGVPTRP
jgi:protein TonB